VQFSLEQRRHPADFAESSDRRPQVIATAISARCHGSNRQLKSSSHPAVPHQIGRHVNMQHRLRIPISVLMICLIVPVGIRAADPVFSGPQVGEKLPGFQVRSLDGERAGQELDLVALADGKPVLLIFVHEITRPGLGLTNTVMRFAASRAESGLLAGCVFLTDDVTKTETWAKRVRSNLFIKGTWATVSLDGLEGPGAYGLNRNVTLTVVIAQQNRVTANFALVQPSEQADGPKIFEQLVKATGGGAVPAIAKFSRRRYKGQSRTRLDPKLAALLNSLLEADADQKTLEQVSAQVKKHLDKNPRSKPSLGMAASRLMRSDRFRQIKHLEIKKQIQLWARTFKQPADRSAEQRPDPNLRPLLRPLIQKTASQEQVDEAARNLEKYIAEHREAAAQLGRISRTVVSSGNLANYGTAAAQAYLKKWAKTLPAAQPAEKKKP